MKDKVKLHRLGDTKDGSIIDQLKASQNALAKKLSQQVVAEIAPYQDETKEPAPVKYYEKLTPKQKDLIDLLFNSDEQELTYLHHNQTLQQKKDFISRTFLETLFCGQILMSELSPEDRERNAPAIALFILHYTLNTINNFFSYTGAMDLEKYLLMLNSNSSDKIDSHAKRFIAALADDDFKIYLVGQIKNIILDYDDDYLLQQAKDGALMHFYSRIEFFKPDLTGMSSIDDSILYHFKIARLLEVVLDEYPDDSTIKELRAWSKTPEIQKLERYNGGYIQNTFYDTLTAWFICIFTLIITELLSNFSSTPLLEILDFKTLLAISTILPIGVATYKGLQCETIPSRLAIDSSKENFKQYSARALRGFSIDLHYGRSTEEHKSRPADLTPITPKIVHNPSYFEKVGGKLQPVGEENSERKEPKVKTKGTADPEMQKAEIKETATKIAKKPEFFCGEKIHRIEHRKNTNEFILVTKNDFDNYDSVHQNEINTKIFDGARDGELRFGPHEIIAYNREEGYKVRLTSGGKRIPVLKYELTEEQALRFLGHEGKVTLYKINGEALEHDKTITNRGTQQIDSAKLFAADKNEEKERKEEKPANDVSVTTSSALRMHVRQNQ